ncbi:conjugative transposon protein TraM [Salegentibacter sp. UBA1130]|uniref:conjugative transposon protein TraM n=1 Tax=Salegentibacter sp. UBA1130 TaxID=1947451 RepID=UPI00257E0B2B|nr:conjugative transposon protein TraM [Salegentibacter sp. UBA1130]
MNIDRKKAVFIGVVVLITCFIVAYGFWGMETDEKMTEKKISNPDVPALIGESEEYQSRMEAVNQLREERDRVPPSLYPDMDFEAYEPYDPYLGENEKTKLMDSILKSGPEPDEYHFEPVTSSFKEKDTSGITSVIKSTNSPDHIPGEGHLEFFFVSKDQKSISLEDSSARFRVSVNGDQVVRKDERLELRTIDPIKIGKDSLASNSLIYARSGFRANRLLLELTGNSIPGGKLVAYDLTDGLEGIYIENSFRSQATTEVLDDVIQDINISGVPQVRGLKAIFQRDNRNVKVKVLHQHQLILKPAL